MKFIGTNAELIEKIKEGLSINDEDLWEMLRNPPHKDMKEYTLYHMFRYELWEEYAQNYRTMELFYRLRTRLQRRNVI